MLFKYSSFIALVSVIVFTVACSSGYKVVRSQYQNLSINQKADSITDENYLNLLKPFSAALDAELTEVVSFADTSLIAYRPESPLSNLISDMLLQFSQEHALEKHPEIKIDFSLENNGGLRSSLPAGEINVKTIFEILPFESKLVLLNLSGQQVSMLANHIVSRGGEGVAGISFGMKAGEAIDIKIHDKPIESASSYWMITNDYLANGGDGMKVLREALQRIETEQKIRDVVLLKLKQMKLNGLHVTAKTDGRIYNVE
jgi:2',3'-cyclic-nucleotide 2'-phosphodiesterase (5'-nucleotidase family)